MEEHLKNLVNAVISLGHTSRLDYIQLIASFVSIIISAIAVIMAVRIPKKIADKQDKITLFDKRFEAYNVFLRYEAFAFQIHNIEGVENYKKQFIIAFYSNEIVEFQGMIALGKLQQLSTPLQHISFLFDNITDTELAELFSSICDFVVAMAKNVNVEECKDRFIRSVRIFELNHIEHIRTELQLSD